MNKIRENAGFFRKDVLCGCPIRRSLGEAQMIQEVPHGIKDPHRRRCTVQDPDEDWSGGGDTIVLDN